MLNGEGNKPSRSDALAPDRSLLEPFLYLSEVSGKDVRGELIDSFQVC